MSEHQNIQKSSSPNTWALAAASLVLLSIPCFFGKGWMGAPVIALALSFVAAGLPVPTKVWRWARFFILTLVMVLVVVFMRGLDIAYFGGTGYLVH